MATGRFILPAVAFFPTGGTAVNYDPALFDISAQASDDQGGYPRWTMADAAIEACEVTFRMPADYASAPVFKYDWYTPATSANCRWVFTIAAISESDAETFPDKDSDSDNVDLVACDGTTNELVQDDIALTNANSVAADDLVKMIVSRTGSHGDDTLTAAAYFLGGIFEYTTT